MAFFTTQYRVLFHDTMAYGSHHHMTNFKFQNYARETFLFGSATNGHEDWKEELKDTVMLTREAHSLNLAPVQLGEKVAILLTYEDPTPSTVRLCFRVINGQGKPVCCGYQTMVLIHKDTMELLPAPQFILKYLDINNKRCVLEELTAPSFAKRVLEGAKHMKHIFSPEILEIGKKIANGDTATSFPKIIDFMHNEYSIDIKDEEESVDSDAIVFTFAGQGSYDYKILRNLYLNYPIAKPFFDYTDQLAKKTFGKHFLPLVEASSKKLHDQLLSESPDFNQFGIYLINIITAKIMMDKGIRPSLLLGHSFGEIAALAIAEVFSIEVGLEIINHRILTLQSDQIAGKMASVSCDEFFASQILKKINKENDIYIAVCNHSKQTIVSGTVDALDELSLALSRKGVSLTYIDSEYPFHSPYLNNLVSPFRQQLNTYEYKSAKIPVYHGTEQTLHTSYSDTPAIIADMFVKPLHFQKIIQSLYNQGYRQFISCEGKGIVHKIISKIGNELETPLVNHTIIDKQYGLKTGFEKVFDYFLYSDKSDTNQGNTKIEASSKTDYQITTQNKNSDKKYPDELCSKEPIAIVGQGCIVPGAIDPNEYWKNITNGINGVVNLGIECPEMMQDFVGGHVTKDKQDIVADKTYTLLNGTILKINYNPQLLSEIYTEDEFNALTRGQRLLALALAQSMDQHTLDKNNSRVQCIIGATADGSNEYDEALFLESMKQALNDIEEPEEVLKGFTKDIESLSGYRSDIDSLSQQTMYSEVLQRFFKKEVNTYVIDSACSSSLYSVNLGIKALQNFESDIILAGGVFAPGPANNTLFAQFRGLTPTQSRPLDSNADGVVFSDGAGMVVLKRLSDAIANEDKVLGVIRGMGLSSDGKSPSINVPKSVGQTIAIKKCYKNSGIPMDSLQYVEVHATATPVGDAVEFNSLKEAFNDHKNVANPVALGSVKSLIGHTGWASGVASIIKICKAFEHQIIPKQYNYNTPNENFDLDNTPFFIPEENQSWQENLNNLPRRAGINGFGFGGTNAHLIIEAFDENYHHQLKYTKNTSPKGTIKLAVVGSSTLFPDTNKLDKGSLGDQSRFNRGVLHLPAKKRLLPDVTDHMDVSHYLAMQSAEEVLTSMSPKWAEFKNNIGVVLGIESKTERGIEAIERIFLDFFKRIMLQQKSISKLKAIDFDRILNKLIEHKKTSVIPSGPYTLPGLMPNVAASRITNIFNLRGPNIVIDKGRDSLLQSLFVANQFLESNDCDIVLAGAISTGHKSIDLSFKEATVLYALVTEEYAQKNDLNILSTISVDSNLAVKINDNLLDFTNDTAEYKGSYGLTTLAEAINQKKADNIKTAQKKEHEYPEVKISNTQDITNSFTSKTYDYIRQTPIYNFTPKLKEVVKQNTRVSLQNDKFLFVIDQVHKWQELEKSGVLDAIEYTVIYQGKENIALNNAIIINLELDNNDQILRKLEDVRFDTIIGLKYLGDYKVDSLLENNFIEERQLIDLLFTITKLHYDHIKTGAIKLLTVCLDAFENENPNGYTGLLSGFIKSVTRELSSATCKMIALDHDNLFKAIQQIETELGQSDHYPEAYYTEDKRMVYKLEKVEKRKETHTDYLNNNSIVIATGGGRGVTAVLAEELLNRYGCTVIALGRTDVSSVPSSILKMDEASLRSFEGVFYKQELSKSKSKNIKQLKKEFNSYLAANELNQVITNLQSLPGTYIYKSVDINNENKIDQLIGDLYATYGKVDMVLHGAGVQLSQILTKKSLVDFRRIISTKIGSLGNFYKAIKKRKNQPVHYHILTSTFSYLGNDGQPDYGAANEAMDRLANMMNSHDKDSYWSSIAWLGWAGIGMTRGSEFAALAANRGLRGVTKEEGQEIFADVISGSPIAPTNILLADGEIKYYKPDIINKQQNSKTVKNSITITHDISTDNAPFLLAHKISNTPTLPGAFITSLIGDAAKKLRPELKITAFENMYSRKFIKVFKDKKIHLRVIARIVSENEKESNIEVKVISDFIHKSGKILQKDIIHSETILKMSNEISQPIHQNQKFRDSLSETKESLPDPYVMGNSKVHLGIGFDVLSRIEVDDQYRKGEYNLLDINYRSDDYKKFMPVFILMDAMWRFGGISVNSNGDMPLCVPDFCKDMRFYFDFTDNTYPALFETISFFGVNPIEDGEMLHLSTIEARDKNGNLLLEVLGGSCKKFDVVTPELTVEQ